MSPRRPAPDYLTPENTPSLGWALLDWYEAYLRVPSGPDYGQPLRLTDEQARIIVRWYQVDPRSGRFIYRRGSVRRSKGWGKSPLLAAWGIGEFVGPVLFDGWDADGRPVGRPWETPWEQIAACSEDQTGNTYSAVYAMLADSPALDEFRVDLGRTKAFLRDRPGCVLEPVTAAAGSREGQPITAAVMDEALALDTPLPTPTGWTTMGDVAVGDELLDVSGRPVTVVKTTGVFTDRPCWRVTFEDGSSVVASDGHLWAVRLARRRNAVSVRSTADLVVDGRRMRVPCRQGVEGQHLDLDVDPYVLGYWLGDGDARNATISVGADDLDEVESLIIGRGFTVRRCRARDRTPLLYVSVEGSVRGFYENRRRPVRGFKVRLREAGLIGNKHIPPMYLRASRGQREDLLAGLMDSDGHVTTGGGCCYATSSDRLVRDVAELLRSLGEVCTVRWHPDARSRTGGGWKVIFTPRGCKPFRLTRKLARVHLHRRGPQWVTIRSIEPAGSVPVRCVAVDSADHLFLAGEGWHVTHNTHLWLPSQGGKRLASTLRRNLGKMNGRSLESTNAFLPGEGSVAEETHKAWEKGEAGIYYDAVEAPWVDDLADKRALRRALKVAYGDSKWVNLTRVIAEVNDPATDPADARRFYLNQLVKGEWQAVDPHRWAELARPDITVPAGSRIGVGFDGSISDDATALRGCTEAGHRFTIAVWERPPGAPRDWRVPRLEVEAKVAETFERFDVGRMLCDPAKWWTEIESWSARWNVGPADDARVTVFDTNATRKMSAACDRYLTAQAEKTSTHDGDPVATRHVLAMAKKKVRVSDPDDDGRTRYVFVKMDTRKIDVGIADVLALEAAMTMPAKLELVGGVW